MPSCSTSVNPRGVEIVFEEESHRYSSIIDGKEILYKSVTGIIGDCFPKFDPDGIITARCAAKEGISVEEMKKRWSDKGKESCRLGTRLHEVCEDIELGRELRNTPENDIEKRRFENGITMAKRFRQSIDILGVEKLVFDERLQIAGTIDLFAQSRKDGSYLIIDHKTNQTIERENKYKKFALDPISHVPDTSFSHYALQLNLYSFMLKYAGYVEKGSKFKFFLNHVTPEKADLIELPDMRSEIKDIVIDYLVKSK